MKKKSSTASALMVHPGSQIDHAVADILDLAAEPINAFEQALGGRGELLATLSLDSSPEIKELLALLLDPEYDTKSLGFLANAVGISLTDLLRAFRNGVLAKAHILSSQRIAEKLPEVVADVMKRAAPYEEPCDACDATGLMTVKPTKKVQNPDPAQISCTICRGKGNVIRLPELDRQRLALEIGELIKSPKGGPTVLQQFNLGNNAAPSAGDPQAGALEKMQQAVTDILYGSRGSVIDLVPLPAEDPAP